MELQDYERDHIAIMRKLAPGMCIHISARPQWCQTPGTNVTGTTIKELREKNKITQMQLAEKIGVSDKTIGMGQAVLMQLLNIFGNIYYSLTFRNHRNAIHENYIHFLVVFFAPVFNPAF